MAFSFGGSGGGGGGFGTPASTTNAATTTFPPNTSTNTTTTITIPEFTTLFPWISIYTRLCEELSYIDETTTATSLQGQKFLHYLRSTEYSSSSGSGTTRWRLLEALGYPDPFVQRQQQQQQQQNSTQEEVRLRESLRTNPYIVLHTKVTHVTPAIYQELISLSNDLQLGMIPTIALYAQASSSSSSTTNTSIVPKLAREIYFQEQSHMVRSLKLLLYRRLAATNSSSSTPTSVTLPPAAIVVATDELFLKQNLIPSILQLIQIWTQRIQLDCSSNSTICIIIPKEQEQVVLSMEEFTHTRKRSFAIQQRQSLAELLYLIAYPTQFTIDELVQLLDCIHSLTDTHFDSLLDPFINVPSIYTTATTASFRDTPTSSMAAPQITTASSTPKQKKQWDEEVIADAYNSGAIAMQSLVHTLVMATLCAMDGSHALWDRTTHAPNNQLKKGITNTLCSQQILYPVHQRLYEPSTEWKRREIWGLFRTAYALLLLTVNDNNTSSSSSSSSSSFSDTTNHNSSFQTPTINIRGRIDTATTGYYANNNTPLAFAATGDDNRRDAISDGVTSSAISSVTSCNTLTWIRTSLLPTFSSRSSSSSSAASYLGTTATASTLGTTTLMMKGGDYINTTNDIVSDFDDHLHIFFKSTLADFLSNYFNYAASLRELPTTRAQWTTDQESQMEYSRLQEEQRRQFSLFASSSAGEYYSSSSMYEDTTPSGAAASKHHLTTSVDDYTVDYSSRPDCLDDVLACIVAVIFSCPACARAFWDGIDNNTISIIDSQLATNTNTTPEQEGQLVVTKPQLSVTFAMVEVQRIVLLDPTITSGYFSLLTALALADDNSSNSSSTAEDEQFEGAAALAIYQLLLSADTTTTASPADDGMTWNKLLHSLESYDMLLTPRSVRSPLPNGQMYNTASYELDTDGYYYGNGRGGDDAYYSYVDPDTVKAKPSAVPLLKPSATTRSVSEAIISSEDEDRIKAMSNLMTIVCSRCKSAHAHFLNFSHSSTSAYMHGGVQQLQMSNHNVPTILSLLFRLLAKPLNVATKGALLNLASVLVRRSTESICKMAWELLEACQILPTVLMSGAGTVDNWNVNLFSPDRTRYGYHFASDSYNSSTYGILHDMNHIESFMGSYPATEGLLLLIYSLVERSGCPTDLGSQWRRPGASPYIEFITAFVLPRCICFSSDGSVEHQPLFFTTPEDRYRLISRALDVLQAVICRYPVPSPSSTTFVGRKQASSVQAFTSKAIVDELRTVTPPLLSEKDLTGEDAEINELRILYEMEANETTGLFPPYLNLFQRTLEKSEFIEAVRDFHDETWMPIPPHNALLRHPGQSLASRFVMAGADSNSNAKRTEGPRPKSPGFILLADILGGGSFLKILLHVLVQDGNVAALTLLEEAQDSAKQTRSLYKSGYLPEYEAVKDFTLSQSRRGLSTFDVRGRLVGKSSDIDVTRFSKNKVIEKNMLVSTPSIHPLLLANTNGSDSPFTIVFDDVLYWRLRSIELTLKLLCAAATRETSFAKAIQGCGYNSLNITPVLKFGSHLEVRTISTIYRVSFLLQQAAGASPFSKSLSTEPLPVLSTTLGYFPPTSDYYNYPNIAEFALAMLSYCSKTLTPSSVFVGALCGRDRGLGARILSRSFALQILGQGLDFNKYETDRRSICIPLEQNRMKILTGILDLILSSLLDKDVPTLAYTLLGFDNKEPYLQELGCSGLNCFSAILHLLDKDDFTQARSSASVASKCYEVVYVLCKAKGRISSYALGLLRRNEFWARHLKRLFASPAKEIDGSGSLSLFESLSAAWSSRLQEAISFDEISIMHSCAFLLSGTALELRSCALDPSIPESHPIYQHGLAPSRQQVFHLLYILFGATHTVMTRILQAMPLQQTRSYESYFVGTALKDTFDSVTCPILGPKSFVSNFRCVDINLLNGKLSSSPTDLKAVAMDYARSWNHYAMAAAAAAHLVTSFDFLMASFLSSCNLMLIGKLDDNSIIDVGFAPGWDDMIGLLNLILTRLSPFETLFLDDESATSKSSHNLEPSSALPLSVAALRLVECIVNISLTEQRLIDLVKSCYLMATAISGCAPGAASYDRAGVLSCGLALLLPAYEHQLQFVDAASMQSDIEFDSLSCVFIEVATFLSYLSSINYKEATTPPSKKNAKLDEIATAARAGLCVILRAFDFEVNEGDATFFSQVFSASDGRSNVTRLVNMLSFSPNDICWVLTQIASCSGGADILLNVDVASALLSGISNTITYGSNEVGNEMIDEMPFGLGIVASEPPIGIIGQLQLLTTLMSAVPENVKLASDVGGFMKAHVFVLGHILSSFPRNGNVTEAFLTCLAVLSSALCDEKHVGTSRRNEELLPRKIDVKRVSGNAMSPSISCVLGNASNRIERNVIDFALHIASHPFPEIFLPKLPSKLSDLEFDQRKQLRQPDEDQGKSWWDRISASGVLLPSPPVGGSVEMFKVGFPALPSRDWRSDDYTLSIMAAKSLEMALIFLCNMTSSSRGVTLSLNPVLLGKGLCRCIIASRAIEDYLSGKRAKTADEASDERQIEREALSTLGPFLGRSSERLLLLALMKVQYLSCELASTVASERLLVDTKDNIDKYCTILLEVLEYTQVERLGVGCVGIDASKETERNFSQNTSRVLRELLTSFFLK